MPRTRKNGLGPVESKFRRRQQEAAQAELARHLPKSGRCKEKEPIRIKVPVEDWAARLEGRGFSLTSDQELAARLLESIEQAQAREPEKPSFEHLLDDPEAAAWLEEFVRRVATGAKSPRTGAFNRVGAFFEEAVLPRDTTNKVSQFLTGKLGNEPWGERAKPVDFDKAAAQFGFSDQEARLLYALVVLLEGRYAVDSVVSVAKEGQYDYLENSLSVTRAEAERICAITSLSDGQRYTKIVEALFHKIGRAVFVQMNREALDRLFNHVHLYFDPFNYQIFNDLLGAAGKEKVKQMIAESGAKEFGVALSVAVMYYEKIFGKLSRQEFLALVPHAAEAPAADLWSRELKERFGFLPPPEPRTRAGRKPVEAQHKGKKVRVVHEEELLRFLRDEADRSPKMPRYLFPPTVEPKRLAAAATGETALARGQALPRALPAPSETVIFVPLNKQEGEYLQVIDRALERMRRETDMAERVQIFLAELWPQFLLARANRAPLGTIAEQTVEALQLLPSGLREDFNLLVKASADTKANAAAIREATGRLRRNRELHDQGVYVWAELLPRKRKTATGEESVDVLSTQSYHLDGVREMALASGPTRILYAGKRLDRIDAEVKAMGINVQGDGEGVVFLEQVKRHVAHNVLPYLTNAAVLVVPEGKQIHPLHGLKQQALRREHGSGRGAKPADIYKKEVWSTTVHETRHEDDRRRGYPRPSAGFNAASEMEVTAYLTSLAMPTEAGEPNQPLTDLIAVIDLYHANVAGLARLGDLFGVNEKAAGKILLRFAEKFGLGGIVTAEVIKQNHLDISADILRRALEAGGEAVQKIAQEILDEIYADYPVAEPAKAGASSPGTAVGTAPARPARRPPAPPAVTIEGMAAALPQGGVRGPLQLEGKVQRPPRPSLLRRLRESVLATGIVAVLGGLVADQQKDRSGEASVDSSVTVASEAPEAREIVGNNVVGDDDWEIDAVPLEVKVKALTTKGLYGYVKVKLGHTTPDAVVERHIEAIARQLDGRFGLRLTGNRGKDIDIIKRWSETIDERKAQQIVALIGV